VQQLFTAFHFGYFRNARPVANRHDGVMLYETRGVEMRRRYRVQTTSTALHCSNTVTLRYLELTPGQTRSLPFAPISTQWYFSI
jgi:hypothetical protein